MIPKNNADFFDVSYGLASVAITATGLVVVATTGGDYHGLSFVAGTTQCTLTIFDSASATAGNILDIMVVNPGGNVWNDRYKPIRAKKGITVSVVGTGGTGAIFYGPKG